MHEMGLAMELGTAAREHAAGRPLKAVYVDVGCFSGVNREALRFGLEAVFRDNTGGPVAIELRDVPAAVRCLCGREYETADLLVPCPACGGFEREITRGKDLVLTGIEVG